MCTAYKEKLIIAGRHIEHYRYELPICKGYSTKRRGRANVATKEVKEENRKKTAQRARKKVARYINANTDMDKFITLTFRENLQDLDEAHRCFDVFMKRLKRKYKGLKYVCVTEFQKRGAIHFHLISSMPYINANKLAKKWGHGFVRINKIDKVENVGAYVTKYMTKESIDDRLSERKCFSMSRNLTKPVEVTDEKEVALVLGELDNVVTTYSKEFETEHNGVCVYTHMKLSEVYTYRRWWERLAHKFKVGFHILEEYVRCPFTTSTIPLS